MVTMVPDDSVFYLDPHALQATVGTDAEFKIDVSIKTDDTQILTVLYRVTIVLFQRKPMLVK